MLIRKRSIVIKNFYLRKRPINQITNAIMAMTMMTPTQIPALKIPPMISQDESMVTKIRSVAYVIFCMFFWAIYAK